MCTWHFNLSYNNVTVSLPPSVKISPCKVQMMLKLTLYLCLTSSYRQAQATVLEALPLLNKHDIATKRPDDYFAEMAKSDQHMQKVSRLFMATVFSLWV